MYVTSSLFSLASLGIWLGFGSEDDVIDASSSKLSSLYEFVILSRVSYKRDITLNCST